MVILELNVTDEEQEILKGIDPMQFPTGVLSPEEYLAVISIGVRNGFLKSGTLWSGRIENQLRINLPRELIEQLKLAVTRLRASPQE